MKNTLLIIGILSLIGCSHIQPYDGVVGYQWHPTNPNHLIFVEEGRSTWRAADMHAAEACATALKATPRELKILKHDTVEGRYGVQIHMPAGVIDGRRELGAGGFNHQTNPNEVYSQEQVKRPFKQVTVLCQS